MRRQVCRALLLLLMVWASACNRGVLDKEEMTDVLFDIYRLQAVIQTDARMVPNEEQAKYYDSVFKKHGTTKEQFDRSLEWYAANPREWQMVHTMLKERGEQYLVRVENYEFAPDERKLGNDTLDTVNLWLPQSRWVYTRGEAEREFEWDHVSENLEAREYFVGALKMELSVHLRCYSPDSMPVTTMMVVHYSKRMEPDTSKMTLPADSVMRVYRYKRPTRGRNISRVEVMLIDSAAAAGLTSLEMDSTQLNYIFGKRGQHIAERYRNEIRIKSGILKGDQSLRQSGDNADRRDEKRDGGVRRTGLSVEDRISRQNGR